MDNHANVISLIDGKPLCIYCQSGYVHNNGKTRKMNQRYICRSCGMCWQDFYYQEHQHRETVL